HVARQHADAVAVTPGDENAVADAGQHQVVRLVRALAGRQSKLPAQLRLQDRVPRRQAGGPLDRVRVQLAVRGEEAQKAAPALFLAPHAEVDQVDPQRVVDLDGVAALD